MKQLFTRLFGNQPEAKNPPQRTDPVARYIAGGKVPWSPGYNEYRWKYISDTLKNGELLHSFASGKKLPENFGVGLDDRTVEYPWIFSRLKSGTSVMLDAGSTFNYPEIIALPALQEKELTITTYFPEKNAFNEKRISYVYADLRALPFRDALFDEIVCQSTIEHIDMDNSIYGYEMEKAEEGQKSYAYLPAVEELLRVLKKDGKLLLTFPYGKFENYGFFQQLDREMLGRIESLMQRCGRFSKDFMLYRKDGWNFALQKDCDDAVSFNPHTGKGKGDDGAAHCRCICCIEFVKSDS